MSGLPTIGIGPTRIDIRAVATDWQRQVMVGTAAKLALARFDTFRAECKGHHRTVWALGLHFEQTNRELSQVKLAPLVAPVIIWGRFDAWLRAYDLEPRPHAIGRGAPFQTLLSTVLGRDPGKATVWG